MKSFPFYKVVLALVFLLTMLLTLSYYMPSEGVKIAGVTFKFPTLERLMNPQRQEKANIDSLIIDVDTTLTVIDPLIKHSGENGNMGQPSGGELSAKAGSVLHYNEEGFSKLSSFFEKLSGVAAKNGKIHILHYGDSQIEGDRMTGFIRERLQNQFGGNGPGLVPAFNVYNTFAFTQSLSPNFKRYTCFGSDKLASRKYGVMGSAARFTPELKDSADLYNYTETKTGWIEISPNNNAYSRSRAYSQVKMIYNSCYSPCLVNVYQNGNLIHQDSLIKDGKQHTLKLNFPNTPGNLKFEFQSKVSPNISHFLLEGDFGVQMSNIGMRGSSGTIFNAMDRSLAGQSLNEMNAELIIMQFGGNSVPSFKDSASVRGYANNFKGQLNAIKAMRPSAAIIVIGPSDMSKLVDGIYMTYPLLPYCVEQMKKVTMEVGGAYWDLYGAMGGRNAMPSWVEKGLAGSDYIHFSNRGASIAAQKFYDSFISEYVNWSTK